MTGLLKKYSLQFCYVLFMYLWIFCSELKIQYNYFLFVAIGFGIINIIYALRLGKRYTSEDIEVLLNSMMLISYGMIPFFLYVSLISVIVELMLTMFTGIGGICFFLGKTFFIFYVAVIQATYGIAYIDGQMRQQRMYRPVGIIHIILQLLLIVNVFDTIYLLVIRNKKWIKVTIAGIILLMAAVIYAVLCFVMAVLSMGH